MAKKRDFAKEWFIALLVIVFVAIVIFVCLPGVCTGLSRFINYMGGLWYGLPVLALIFYMLLRDRLSKDMKDLSQHREKIYAMFVVIGIWAILDHYDLGVCVGAGIFRFGDPTALVTALTGLVVAAYVIETNLLRKATQEQMWRQLQPYLSIHWVSCKDKEGNEVIKLLARNDGKGLMRSVKYNIKIGDETIAVKEHNTITAGTGGTNIAFKKDKDKERLRNVLVNDNSNDQILIWGSYRDVFDHRYCFYIKRDTDEQSCFRDQALQKMTPDPEEECGWKDCCRKT